MAAKQFSLATLLLSISLNFYFLLTNADYGGWDTAHATFYGGGDASGTMGMPLTQFLVENPHHSG